MEGKWTDRGDGVLVLKNERGEVIETQKTKGGKARVLSNKRNEPYHYVLDGRGKKVWVPKGTNPDHLPREVYPYSEVTADHILRHVTEGKTLTQVAKIEGIPPIHILYKWLREYPEFKSQLNEAKKSRAEWRADQVMAIADEEDIDEDAVPGKRLRKDILQWGAEMDDRATFGKQQKIVGDASQPIAFTVVTGVPEPAESLTEPGPGERVLSAPPVDSPEAT